MSTPSEGTRDTGEKDDISIVDAATGWLRDGYGDSGSRELMDLLLRQIAIDRGSIDRLMLRALPEGQTEQDDDEDEFGPVDLTGLEPDRLPARQPESVAGYVVLDRGRIVTCARPLRHLGLVDEAGARQVANAINEDLGLACTVARVVPEGEEGSRVFDSPDDAIAWLKYEDPGGDGVCRWCRDEYGGVRPKNFGSDPKCALLGVSDFETDNWQCAGVGKLREAARDAEVWNEDQYCAVLPIPDTGTFIVLSYYKHRSRTEGAWVVDEDKIRPLTAPDVSEYLIASTEGGDDTDDELRLREDGKARTAADVTAGGSEEATGPSVEDSMEMAWGLIANAWAYVERDGPAKSSREWVAAAERWRDEHWDPSVEITHPPASVEATPPEERLYPCANVGCDVMRTEAEGGTVFTICEKCWAGRSVPGDVEPVAWEMMFRTKGSQYWEGNGEITRDRAKAEADGREMVEKYGMAEYAVVGLTYGAPRATPEDKPEGEIEWVDINLNDRVRVRLNDDGIAMADGALGTPDADGYVETQWHCLANVLGPRLVLGLAPPCSMNVQARARSLTGEAKP